MEYFSLLQLSLKLAVFFHGNISVGIVQNIENGDSQVSMLREKLQLINALSSKPESDRSEALKKGECCL